MLGSGTDLVACDRGLDAYVVDAMYPPAPSLSAFGISSELELKARLSRGSIWRLPSSPDPN